MVRAPLLAARYLRGRSNSLEELVMGESGQLERRDPLVHPHSPKGKYHMFEIVSVTNQPQSTRIS
jgi:hypothetical protein